MECLEVAQNGIVECANSGDQVTASCVGGQTISVLFGFYGWKETSYGDGHSTCTGTTQTPCQSSTAESLIRAACDGQTTCSLDVTSGGLGATDCGSGTEMFAEILYNCS